MCCKLVAAAMLCAFFNFILSCAAPARRFVSPETVPRLTKERIVKVILARGEVIKFDAEGARYHENYKNKQHVIVGKTEEGEPVVIGLNQVLRACIEKDHVAVEDSEQAFSALLIALIAGLPVAAFANGGSGL